MQFMLTNSLILYSGVLLQKTVHITSQIHPLYNITKHFVELNFNIILPTARLSSNWSVQVYNQTMKPFLLHASHILCASHHSEYVHHYSIWCQSRWPCCLRRRSVIFWVLGLQVRIMLRAWSFVSCVRCVLFRCWPLRRADHSFRKVLPALCVYFMCLKFLVNLKILETELENQL
jgi:hypothetical protein